MKATLTVGQKEAGGRIATKEAEEDKKQVGASLDGSEVETRERREKRGG